MSSLGCLFTTPGLVYLRRPPVHTCTKAWIQTDVPLRSAPSLTHQERSISSSYILWLSLYTRAPLHVPWKAIPPRIHPCLFSCILAPPGQRHPFMHVKLDRPAKLGFKQGCPAAPRTGHLCEKPDFASVPSNTCMNGSHSNTWSWAHWWSQGSRKGVQRGPDWTPLLEAWLHRCAKQHVFEWGPLARWSQDSAEWAWADLRSDGFLGYVWQDTSAKAQTLDVTGRDASRLVC